jgi:putative NADPH-quinone reductase
MLIVDGHPDADKARFLHALADSYRHGAEIAGHEVRTVRLCELAIPFLAMRGSLQRNLNPGTSASS